MCGIFAIVPKRKATYRMYLAFIHLVTLNENRGGHSWGLWSQHGDIVHGLGCPTDGDSMIPMIQFVGDWWSRCQHEGNVGTSWIAGHTRYATQGAKTLSNAHPFENDIDLDYKRSKEDHPLTNKFVLAHNGVVWVDNYGPKDHAVDSGQMALAIRDLGLEKGLKSVRGSLGLIMSFADKLYVYQANQTLHMAELDDMWIVTSSEAHLKECLSQLIGEKLKASAIKDLVKEVPRETLIAPWYNFQPVKYEVGGRYQAITPVSGYRSTSGYGGFYGDGYEGALPGFNSEDYTPSNRRRRGKEGTTTTTHYPTPGSVGGTISRMMNSEIKFDSTRSAWVSPCKNFAAIYDSTVRTYVYLPKDLRYRTKDSLVELIPKAGASSVTGRCSSCNSNGEYLYEIEDGPFKNSKVCSDCYDSIRADLAEINESTIDSDGDTAADAEEVKALMGIVRTENAQGKVKITEADGTVKLMTLAELLAKKGVSLHEKPGATTH